MNNATFYKWNSANRLVEVDYQANSEAAVQVLATYAYDAFGRMVFEAEGSQSEIYVYDGQNLLLVLQADGQVVERELNGPAVDQVLASETATPTYPNPGQEIPGKVNWLLTDRQGTVRDVAQFSTA